MNELRLRIRDISRQDLERLTHDIDVSMPEHAAAVDPFTITVLASGVVVGAKLVMRLVNEWRGGVVIDLRQDPVDVRRDHDLPYLFFVIVARDGEVRIEGKDEPKDALERLCERLFELVRASADDVSAIVAEVLSPAK